MIKLIEKNSRNKLFKDNNIETLVYIGNNKIPFKLYFNERLQVDAFSDRVIKFVTRDRVLIYIPFKKRKEKRIK